MNNYYNKLLNRNQLIKFWSFANNELKITFQNNYKFIFYFYQKNIVLDFNLFISIVKKIFPIFHSIVDSNGNFLFITTKSMYLQTIYYTKSKIVSYLKDFNVGIFTNFSNKGFELVDNLSMNTRPSLVFFFNILENNFLLLESKKKIFQQWV